MTWKNPIPAKTASYHGIKEINKFKKSFIEKNRGSHLYLMRFDRIQDKNLLSFIRKIKDKIKKNTYLKKIEFSFINENKHRYLLMGLAETDSKPLNNIESLIGGFYDKCLKTPQISFVYGIARTQCNWISDEDEIFNELLNSSMRNLNDNLVRWSWTYFNKVNSYLSNFARDAVIQPTIHYDSKSQTFSVVGGEVFVGGETYQSYKELCDQIPDGFDKNRIEMLILEKLILSCKDAPGLLKFNISPQSLIDGFDQPKKVDRFIHLLKHANLKPENIRLELMEKPYEEAKSTLKDVCKLFWDRGVSFAADDFGLRSQSHQVVLDLGVMIKEFKLDPISFKFKPEEDNTKFLDNLAFIDYCKHLSDNREAIICAEAVEDLDTLKFLLTHNVAHFQTFLFSYKLPVKIYLKNCSKMQNLPLDAAEKILSTKNIKEKLSKYGNIFSMADASKKSPKKITISK
jgi:EAL domain-containing protein (putative c-di-GMP-specific phosphodiesterase class I)